MLSTAVLHFHSRPEVGPGVDQLKIGRLADGPRLKRRSIQKPITGAAVDNDKFVRRRTKEVVGDRLCAQVGKGRWIQRLKE